MPITAYRDTEIYVLCPANVKSGGPELLHQLVHKLKLFGYNANIVYTNVRPENLTAPRDPDYDVYLSDYLYISDVIVDEKNIIVIPEVSVALPYKLIRIRKLMWFLSLDNYIIGLYSYLNDNNLKHLAGIEAQQRFICGFKNVLSVFATNSFRCAAYLKSMGVENPEMLTEYINKTYFDIPKNVIKQDIVAYNPKKGFEFTKMIIKKDPFLNFIPIENLDAEGVKALLLSAKVYIDFGNHPGKDRLPREAGACGCCVITGKRGSAAYFEDVPLPEEFKFEDTDENLDAIIDKIKLCLSSYDSEHAKLEHFRECIRNEEQRFENEIKSVFVKSDKFFDE